MAAPQVAGAAALLLSVYAAAGADLEGRGPELKAMLLASVDKFSQLSGLLLSGGRLNVGAALAGVPTDLSVFKTNPKAKLPYATSPPPARPAFDIKSDLYFTAGLPTLPGDEIAGLARVGFIGSLPLTPGPSVVFNASGLLSAGSSVYDCLCSSCLGPEVIYAFQIAAPAAGAATGNQWFRVQITATPSESIMISVFRRGLLTDSNVVLLSTNRGRSIAAGSYLTRGVCGGITKASVAVPMEVTTFFHWPCLKKLGQSSGVFKGSISYC